MTEGFKGIIGKLNSHSPNNCDAGTASLDPKVWKFPPENIVIS